MIAWIERRARAVRNRVRKWRRSPAYDTFLGVLWALAVFEIARSLIATVQ